VTQRVYDAFRRNKGLPARDVWTMQPNERDAIYELQYWNKCRCSDLPTGVDYAIMDAAVNSGVVRSAQWLQRALGVKADGLIGEATIAAVQAYPNYDDLIAKICTIRLRFVQALPTWGTYGHGWRTRILNVQAVGQSWATGQEISAPVPVMLFGSTGAKAEASNVNLPSATNGVMSAGAGGTLLGSITDLQNALMPLQGSLKIVDNAIYVLMAIGTVMMVGGAFYAIYAHYRRKEVTQALDLPIAA
jgi:lysozyme family protein